MHKEVMKMEGFDMFVESVKKSVGNGKRAVVHLGAYPGKVEISMVKGTYMANFWNGNCDGRRQSVSLSDMPKGPSDEDYRRAAGNMHVY